MAILGVPSSKEDLLARQAATPMSFAEFVEATPRHLTLQPALRTLQPAPWQLKLAFHKLFIALQREATKSTKATPRETALLFASPFRGGSHRQLLGRDAIHHLGFRERNFIACAAQARHPAHDLTVQGSERGAPARDLPECRPRLYGDVDLNPELRVASIVVISFSIMPCPLVMDSCHLWTVPVAFNPAPGPKPFPAAARSAALFCRRSQRCVPEDRHGCDRWARWQTQHAAQLPGKVGRCRSGHCRATETHAGTPTSERR